MVEVNLKTQESNYSHVTFDNCFLFVLGLQCFFNIKNYAICNILKM